MVCKLEIYGTIEVMTGLHIGGAKAFSAIGAVDSTCIRDKSTGFPMIPGSSLKGKMRTLLQRMKQNGSVLKQGWDYDDEQVKRLFGGKIVRNQTEHVIFSRLQFFDCFISDKDKTKDSLEIKAENTINRWNAIANPRSIERVVRGTHFDFRLGYDVPFDKNGNLMCDEIRQDFVNIDAMMKLLEADYLGGSGSRGYGRIAFQNIKLKKRFGELPECYEALNNAEVDWDEALHIMED